MGKSNYQTKLEEALEKCNIIMKEVLRENDVSSAECTLDIDKQEKVDCYTFKWNVSSYFEGSNIEAIFSVTRD